MKYFKYVPLILVLLLCYPLYITFLNPISPKESIVHKLEKNSSITELVVDYSRPYKKGRLVFGSEEDGALVPYSKYWRTGANFCTDFYNSTDVSFNGVILKSGKYFLYSFPNKNSWDVVLNSEHGRFGFFNPNRENDVLKTNVPSYSLDEDLEQFTIDFITENQELYLRFRWEKTGISIPIK